MGQSKTKIRNPADKTPASYTSSRYQSDDHKYCQRWYQLTKDSPKLCWPQWGSFDRSKLLYLKTQLSLKANKTSNQEWECFHRWFAEMAERERKSEASSFKALKAASAPPPPPSTPATSLHPSLPSSPTAPVCPSPPPASLPSLPPPYSSSLSPESSDSGKDKSSSRLFSLSSPALACSNPEEGEGDNSAPQSLPPCSLPPLKDSNLRAQDCSASAGQESVCDPVGAYPFKVVTKQSSQTMPITDKEGQVKPTVTLVSTTQYNFKPWERGELQAIKKDFPDPRQDPIGFADQFGVTLQSYRPGIPDICLLVVVLVGKGEARNWWKKAEIKATIEEMQKTDWVAHKNQEDHYREAKALGEALIEAIPAAFPRLVDFSKIKCVTQRSDETVFQFYNRLAEVFDANSGLVHDREGGGQTQFLSYFVNNLQPSLSRNIKITQPEWQSKHPQFIAELASQLAQTLATQAEEDLEAKRELRTKKDQVYTMQLQQLTAPVPTSHSPPIATTRRKRGNCHYCKKPGHWKSECRTRLKVLEQQKRQGHYNPSPQRP